MSAWEGINRRKFPRVKYPCLIVMHIDSVRGKDVVLTHTENIGIGGVCVVLKNALKMFSEIEIQLNLLDMEDPIKCRGKVVWCVQRQRTAAKKPLFFDIGIEYIDIDDISRRRLDCVVKALVKNGDKKFDA
ncbi:MAG TPA: PilZ domain-containing protein [Candidatus Omnitrophota bacterium]|nr:PilZ domain-containing protein [Candidatus Omnitrophota bacterium]